MSFGSEASTVSQVVSSLGKGFGAVNVRLYAPFLDHEFFKALPDSTSKIIVVGQAGLDGVHSSAHHPIPLVQPQ